MIRYNQLLGELERRINAEALDCGVVNCPVPKCEGKVKYSISSDTGYMTAACASGCFTIREGEGYRLIDFGKIVL